MLLLIFKIVLYSFILHFLAFINLYLLYTIFTYSSILNHIPEHMASVLILEKCSCERSPVYLRKKIQKSFKGNPRMVKRALNLEPGGLVLLLALSFYIFVTLVNLFADAILTSIK